MSDSSDSSLSALALLLAWMMTVTCLTVGNVVWVEAVVLQGMRGSTDHRDSNVVGSVSGMSFQGSKAVSSTSLASLDR